MSPRARQCKGCGAPLPDSAAGSDTVACRFCGMVHDLSAPGPAVHVTQIDVSGSVGQAARWLRWIVLSTVLFFVVGAAALMLIPLYFVQQSARMLAPSSNAPAATPPPATAVMSMRDLAATGDNGWRPIAAEAPPGGWQAFDPVAGASWATSLAHDWAPDAALTRIDVERVAASGMVNLAGGPDDLVRYRFVSPQRIARQAEAAETGARTEAPFGLFLQAAQQRVTASLQRGRPPQDAETRPMLSLPLPDVLSRARGQKAFEDHPFYSGYVIPLNREGWVWYFTPLARQASLPRVRARDGRVYPYR